MNDTDWYYDRRTGKHMTLATWRLSIQRDLERTSGVATREAREIAQASVEVLIKQRLIIPVKDGA